MSRIPHSRNFRTTGTGKARSRTFNHADFAGRAGNGSSSNQASVSLPISNLIFWLGLALAAWLLITHPIATLGAAIVLGVVWAFFSKK